MERESYVLRNTDMRGHYMCIIYHKLSFSIFVHNSQITIIILHVSLQNEFLALPFLIVSLPIKAYAIDNCIYIENQIYKSLIIPIAVLLVNIIFFYRKLTENTNNVNVSKHTNMKAN